MCRRRTSIGSSDRRTWRSRHVAEAFRAAGRPAWGGPILPGRSRAGRPTMTTMSSSTSSPSSSSASSSSGVEATGAGLERIGSDAPARDSRPVGADDRAVVAVVSDMDAAQDAVERLIAAGIGTDHVSVVGKDAQSPRRVNGFVTTGSIAGQSAAAGAWIGGVFGLLMGTALLFVPGAGPLIVLGPLAAAAVGAAQGGLLGGAVAVLLGHFVEDDERQRYEQLVRDGCCLIVVHGDEQEAARARQRLDEAGPLGPGRDRTQAIRRSRSARAGSPSSRCAASRCCSGCRCSSRPRPAAPATRC